MVRFGGEYLGPQRIQYGRFAGAYHQPFSRPLQQR